jgi:hypothetical protein
VKKLGELGFLWTWETELGWHHKVVLVQQVVEVHFQMRHKHLSALLFVGR